MKAGKLLTLWIIIKSFYVTLHISVLAIYYSYRSVDRRAACDGLLRWWSTRLLRFVGLTYETVDSHHLKFEPNRRYMIMSNHSSLYDIPIVFMALPPASIRMLTKKELFQVPVWGRGMVAGEFISIDRKNRKQAFRDLEEARKKMENGIVLWVAPEGTRSRTGELLPFKKGAFMLALQTGATIIPVGIRGAYDVLPAKTSRFHLGRHVQVHIGAPIDASQYKKQDRDQLMLDVEARIRELTGSPTPGQVDVPMGDT
jgi:1-acyl-sn-glycerol-3-phosphate acyltransferase